MNPNEPPRGTIGPLAAGLLFAALAIIAVATLKGTARWIALVIVGGLAAKAYVQYLRDRVD